MTSSAEKTQKKHHFNIVDFILIIAVLACVIGVAVRYNLRSALLSGSDTATVTVLIEGLLDDSRDALMLGDTYYYQKTGNKLGVLTDFRTEPARIRKTTSDGHIVTTTYTNRSDVYCTVDLTGYHTENGFMVGGSTYIGCGSSILVRSPHLETQFTVLDIVIH